MKHNKHRPRRMTLYQKLEDTEGLPQYNDTTNTRAPESQYIPYTPQRVENASRSYQREINRGCIVISLLNFLCCWWCGIPALIFAILGLEAEKKGETMKARNYGSYVSLFNKFGCVYFICFTFCFIFTFSIMWFMDYTEYSVQTVQLITATMFGPTTNPYSIQY